ncbi:MAG: PLP-dependent enzyme glutamate decarboxylase [Gemmatimonadetes bacterium]|nr:PLP-dependent enzyme glutamate decarboxylase [Gemmatimonadota bacterium]
MRPRALASPALHRAVHHALQWIDGLDDRPVGSTVAPEDLRRRLGGPLPQSRTDAAAVIDELVAATEGAHLGSVGGRFFAWVIGGALPAALAADWLTSTWDQPSALYRCGPAASIVEEVAGAWVKELLDLPRDTSFAFTTGCQLAHFTALAAARHALLARTGWNVEADGLCGAPPIRVLTSEHRHGSIDRAVRFLGIGTRSLIPLRTDADARITMEALDDAFRESHGPTIVVLNAADLNVAAFDPFAELIPRAHAAGAWVHIDGAFGLFARVSRAKRSLLAGVEAADSWATDAHKWLNVPFDCGICIIRDRAAHRAAMTVSASYMSPDSNARDQIDWTPEWSRRSRGFAVYAALRELGAEGLEALIDDTCAHCRELVSGLGGLPGAESVVLPQLNQGLVRFRDPAPGAQDDDHDRYTDTVIQAINATGEAFFSGTTWKGRRAMRVSVVNWRTTSADVRRAIEAARLVLSTLSLTCATSVD